MRSCAVNGGSPVLKRAIAASAVAAASPMASWVDVIGDSGVGKRAFVSALGADLAPFDGCDARKGVDSYTLALTPQALPLSVRVYSDKTIAEDSTAKVFLLLFDLTRRETFVSVIVQWIHNIKLRPDDNPARAVLVGMKADLVDEREVFSEEGQELVGIDFDHYLEVAAFHPLCDGVRVALQLFKQWTSEEMMGHAHNDEPELSPRPSEAAVHPWSPPCTNQSSLTPERKTKACVRASIYLYDPTEEEYTVNDEAKIRPVAQALYDLRVSTKDRTLGARQRAAERAPLVARSRYYGPTTSSRQMQWQQAQKAQAVKPVGRRPPPADLSNKSFMQTTELSKLRQRNSSTTTNRLPTSSAAPPRNRPRDGQRRSRSPTSRSKSRAKSTNESSDGKPSSPKPRLVERRPSISIDMTSPTQHDPVDLISPGPDNTIALLPTPVPLEHLQSPIPPNTLPFIMSQSHELKTSCLPDTELFPSPPVSTVTRHSPVYPRPQECQQPPGSVKARSRYQSPSPPPSRSPSLSMAIDLASTAPVVSISDRATSKQGDVGDIVDDTDEVDVDLSGDIDAMLDYFDGVSLPI